MNPLGNVWSTIYNSRRLVEATVDPTGKRVTFGYDAVGNRTSVSGSIWSTVYDSSNRPIAAVDPLGNRSTIGYDQAGHVQFSMNPLGDVSTFVYDVADNLVATSIRWAIGRRVFLTKSAGPWRK
jgi:YD repeat-containing protein